MIEPERPADPARGAANASAANGAAANSELLSSSAVTGFGAMIQPKRTAEPASAAANATAGAKNTSPLADSRALAAHARSGVSATAADTHGLGCAFTNRL